MDALIDDSLTILQDAISLKADGYKWSEVASLINDKYSTNMSGEALRSRVKRYKRKAKAGINPDIAQVHPVEISGITALDGFYNQSELTELWSKVITNQDQQFRTAEILETAQQIKINHLPFALALIGDTHFGNSGTDYRALLEDAQIISETSGMYVGFAGDATDNYVIGKLIALQAHQSITLKQEWSLFIDWLELIKDKLLFAVAGNHDNWTQKLIGIDRLREALADKDILYNDQELVFRLVADTVDLLVKVRHKWKGSSIYNPTHGPERDRLFGNHPFDIGIAAHTHTGTIFRQNVFDDKVCTFVQLGAYKRLDKYGRELGFKPVFSSGCAAIVVDKIGNVMFANNLQTARTMLEAARLG